MSFERNRVQVRCESFLGARDLNHWKTLKSEFESFALTQNNVNELTQDLIEDAVDFHFKGLLSLCEGIKSISTNLYSWGTVKLYYSIYYFLRSSLSIKGYSVIRNKSLYLLRIKVGEKPIKKSAKRYNTNHEGTLNYYKDLFENSDKLQSNFIEGINPYFWIMGKRNQINYRERIFHDPCCPIFLNKIRISIEKNNYDSLLSTYINDSDYIYCFQEDHATLALPIKRAIITKKEFLTNSVDIKFPIEKKKLLRKLLTIKRKLISNIDKIL